MRGLVYQCWQVETVYLSLLGSTLWLLFETLSPKRRSRTNESIFVLQERNTAMPIDLDDDSSSVQSQDTDKREFDRLLTNRPYSINYLMINNSLATVPETPTSGSKLSKGSSTESTPIPAVPEEAASSSAAAAPRQQPTSVASSSEVSANRKRLLAEEATTMKEKEDERKPVRNPQLNDPPKFPSC